MRGDLGGLRQWTERFTVASAASLSLSLALVGVLGEGRLPVLVALFGFVCPMIFGMGYLLLPPYVGKTLVDDRLPGVHFVLAYAGAGLLVSGWVRDGTGALFAIGAVTWALGVAVFLTALVATVAPVVWNDPTEIVHGNDHPQRSTRLATAMLPLAIGYLGGGTVVLLQVAGIIGAASWTASQGLHLYAAGFGTLLILSLSARLLLGFYHVALPPTAVWVVLLSGAVAPGLLATIPLTDRWFVAGAVLESVAMVGYLGLVVLVARRTDRRRFGLLGIGLGAIAGVLAVAVVAPLAVGSAVVERAVPLHRALVLWGFFPLTIVGYAFLFFPVTEGQFPGATRRVATTTVLLLAGGLLGRVIGIGTDASPVHLVGVVASLLGAAGYTYLLVRRFYG